MSQSRGSSRGVTRIAKRCFLYLYCVAHISSAVLGNYDHVCHCETIVLKYVVHIYINSGEVPRSTRSRQLFNALAMLRSMNSRL